MSWICIFLNHFYIKMARPLYILYLNQCWLFLSIWPSGTNFNKISFENQKFALNKMHLQMSFVKRGPFCLGLHISTVSSVAVLARDSCCVSPVLCSGSRAFLSWMKPRPPSTYTLTISSKTPSVKNSNPPQSWPSHTGSTLFWTMTGKNIYMYIYIYIYIAVHIVSIEWAHKQLNHP